MNVFDSARVLIFLPNVKGKVDQNRKKKKEKEALV